MLFRSANMLAGSSRAFVPAWVSAASIVSRSSATSTSTCSALGSGAAAEAGCSTLVTRELQPQVNLLLPLGGLGVIFSDVRCDSTLLASLLAGVHVFSAFMSGVTGQSSPLATAAPKRASERDYTEWNILCLGSVRSTRSPPAPKPHSMHRGRSFNSNGPKCKKVTQHDAGAVHVSSALAAAAAESVFRARLA